MQSLCSFYLISILCSFLSALSLVLVLSLTTGYHNVEIDKLNMQKL